MHLGKNLSPYLHLVGAASFGPLFVEIVDHALLHRLRSLVGHDSDGELAGDLHRDDGLGARVGEGTMYAVQRQRRVTPPGHQSFALPATGDSTSCLRP